jgi:hypothetical protein
VATRHAGPLDRRRLGGPTPDPAVLSPGMARDDEVEAILEHGRRTRQPTPRGLWIAAAIVGAVCAVGFMFMMLAEPATSPSVPHRESSGGGGLGIGLAIGLCAGVVIGFAIGRQRADHSSRNKP